MQTFLTALSACFCAILIGGVCAIGVYYLFDAVRDARMRAQEKRHQSDTFDQR